MSIQNLSIRPGANLKKAELRHAQLQGAQLQGAHLEGAHLEGAHLEEAHLEGAFLQRAHLEGAHLDGINLRGAHLEEAHLEGAHLEYANLEGAHLERAYLEGANFKNSYLIGANLEGARLEGTIFEKTKLSWANLQGTNLERASIEKADFTGANLTGIDLLRLELSDVQRQQIMHSEHSRKILFEIRAVSALLYEERQVRLERLELRESHLNYALLEDTYLERAHLEGAHLEEAILKRAHLEEAHLEGAHLERSDLKEAFLQRAHLEEAHLEHAELNGANLEEAHLEEAHLEYAKLQGAHLEGAHLEGAHLEYSFLTGAHLREIDLRGANLKGINLEGAHLEGALLQSAQLDGVHLQRAYLMGAFLQNASLSVADLSDADLRGVNLRGANLQFVHLERSILVDADLRGVDFTGSNLTGANLTGANLTGAILTEVILSDTQRRQIAASELSRFRQQNQFASVQARASLSNQNSDHSQFSHNIPTKKIIIPSHLQFTHRDLVSKSKNNSANNSCPNFRPLYDFIMEIELTEKFKFKFENQSGVDAKGLTRIVYDLLLPVYTKLYFEFEVVENAFLLLKEDISIEKLNRDTSQIIKLAKAGLAQFYLQINPQLLELLLLTNPQESIARRQNFNKLYGNLKNQLKSIKEAEPRLYNVSNYLLNNSLKSVINSVENMNQLNKQLKAEIYLRKILSGFGFNSWKQYKNMDNFIKTFWKDSNKLKYQNKGRNVEFPLFSCELKYDIVSFKKRLQIKSSSRELLNLNKRNAFPIDEYPAFGPLLEYILNPSEAADINRRKFVKYVAGTEYTLCQILIILKNEEIPFDRSNRNKLYRLPFLAHTCFSTLDLFKTPLSRNYPEEWTVARINEEITKGSGLAAHN